MSGSRSLEALVQSALEEAMKVNPPKISKFLSDYLLRFPDILIQVLAESGYQPDHYVACYPDTWVIQYSLPCRVTGRMFDCEYHKSVADLFESGDLKPSHGRYIIHLKDGKILLARV